MKKVIIVLFVFVISNLYSTIINIPADQPTIQAGIDISVDADTVLVQPGTYTENINYNGKDITIASLFLTTQDTSFISQTIIDGIVVIFESGEDSTAVLYGFSIVNGFAQGSWPNSIGAGINCINNSNPYLQHLIIHDNVSEGDAGGIFFYNSNAKLTNSLIYNNNSFFYGAGLLILESDIQLLNVGINNNTAYATYGGSGGGIAISESNVSLENVNISYNQAGIEGGGIFYYGSEINLSNVTINNNSAKRGGGIFIDDSNIFFNTNNRCNIYLNHANVDNDLHTIHYQTINVIVDTFTVLQPNSYFAYPIDKFSFDILNSKIDQVNSDLYVSSFGSNGNSGITLDDPLLNIEYALAKVIADSLNPHTIFLENGIYSLSQTEERFPINCRSYISLEGEEMENTIIDSEGLNNILYCWDDNNLSIKNMTIQNGNATSSPSRGGGIFCAHSSPNLLNIKFFQNTANSGGGLYFIYSNPTLTKVSIINNQSSMGGGITCLHSYPNLYNVTFNGNSANDTGGGIYSILDSHPNLVNCILWNNIPQEIYSSSLDTITVIYSDIQGGWEGDGNIDSNPLFVDAANGDYHLTENSPCIDAGDPTSPLDPDGTIADMGAFYFDQLNEIDDNEIQIVEFILSNHPNPFNPTTTISFSILEESKVELSIYNIKGQKIKSLLSNQISAGEHSIVWNGEDFTGKKVSSGIYFYKLSINGKIEAVNKCLLLK
ncbi:MAG: T9SS type A sorting domain-containing protein [Candidatus Cloacimonetes bacterium]|nr:T9SS type A sorting domain-containing protein [Candidatus Cloacimonadota bacterium]